MRCPKCKAKLEITYTFCNKCGTPIDKNANPAPNKKKRIIVFFVLGFVLTFVIFFIAILFTPSHDILMVEIDNQQVEFDQPLTFSVEYLNTSLSKMDENIPIYMDEEVVLENEIALAGNEGARFDYEIYIAEPGEYSLIIEDQTFAITALGPPDFYVGFAEMSDLLIVDELWTSKIKSIVRIQRK